MIIRVQDTFLNIDISYIKVYTNHTITKSFSWDSSTNKFHMPSQAFNFHANPPPTKQVMFSISYSI